mmetsp:Transcript_6424/g.11119  ORF Transcript_6424/g.11119 Transcript_6424/m.11119 type:complete len:344 (-) Transcript_6424:7761-8792(-)
MDATMEVGGEGASKRGSGKRPGGGGKQPHGNKQSTRRTGGLGGINKRVKVSVRRLPDCFVDKGQFEEELQRILAENKKEFDLNILQFIPGKHSSSESVQSTPACAIIEFTEEKAAVAFCRFLDGQEFVAKPVVKQEQVVAEEEKREETDLPEGGVNKVEEQVDFPTVACTCDLTINRVVLGSILTSDSRFISKFKRLSGTIGRTDDFLGYQKYQSRKAKKTVKRRSANEDGVDVTTSDVMAQPASALLKSLIDRERRKMKKIARSRRTKNRKADGEEDKSHAKGRERPKKKPKGKGVGKDKKLDKGGDAPSQKSRDPDNPGGRNNKPSSRGWKRGGKPYKKSA